jgi:hypothetical protein
MHILLLDHVYKPLEELHTLVGILLGKVEDMEVGKGERILVYMVVRKVEDMLVCMALVGMVGIVEHILACMVERKVEDMLVCMAQVGMGMVDIVEDMLVCMAVHKVEDMLVCKALVHIVEHNRSKALAHMVVGKKACMVVGMEEDMHVRMEDLHVRIVLVHHHENMVEDLLVYMALVHMVVGR